MIATCTTCIYMYSKCIHMIQMCACLDNVFLYTSAFMTAENGQQLVVGDEEEAGKGVPLGVEVVVEALLTALQPVLYGLQVL